MSAIFGFDAFSPTEIAARVEAIGVAKARLPLLPMLMLSALAGAFIGLGALYFVLIRSDPSLGFAARQVLGGLAFSLGLVLVVVAGAELFTGNNLLTIAWADGKITSGELLRNWLTVCVGNLIGALGLALLVFLSRHADLNDGAIGREYLKIAAAKVSMPFWTAFFRGVLCNVLVCMAVWMALAGRSVVDKVIAIVFPISAFVAAGFEHSAANMYLIPLAMLLQSFDAVGASAASAGGVTLTWLGFFGNLLPVILGNIVGGSVLVSLVYYVIYRRRPGVGPNLEAEFGAQRRLSLREFPLRRAPVLTEQTIASLPEPVRRYLRVTGSIGKPPIQNLQASFDAEMFSKPGRPGMPGPVEQFEQFDPPRRLFLMRTRIYGLPVAVLHDYDNTRASMRVRVASLFTVVDVHSAELARTETVTLLNDICILAPSLLADSRLVWRPIDDTHVGVSFTNGPHQVSAVLAFDAAGYLVNFVSDDRGALQDDGTMKRFRWSTPVRDYREFDGRRIATRGEAAWHYPQGDFVYGRFIVKSIHYDVDRVH